VIDTQPEAIRVKKTYSFLTASRRQRFAPLHDMTGSGEFTFDRQQGAIRALMMKYTINVKRDARGVARAG